MPAKHKQTHTYEIHFFPMSDSTRKYSRSIFIEAISVKDAGYKAWGLCPEDMYISWIAEIQYFGPSDMGRFRRGI